MKEAETNGVNHMKKSAYDRVTERIIELLEQDICPWRRPWNRTNMRPQNFASGNIYNGINLFLLEAMAFDNPVFLTFKQVKETGGNIIKGSKGFPVVYWGTFEVEAKATEEDKTKAVPFLKYFTVFNASQIEGIDFPDPPQTKDIEFNPISKAQQIIDNWTDGPDVQHGFKHACYIRDKDIIQLPPQNRFVSPEEYYSTRFHEMGHATGSEHRLNRKKGEIFGDTQYSREELIAEMTSAFLCAECGIDNSIMENSAAYLKGWIKVLKGDSKLIVTAASQAQKAANLILGKQPQNQQEKAS